MDRFRALLLIFVIQLFAVDVYGLGPHRQFGESMDVASVFFVDAQNGWLLRRSSKGSCILRTSDGGRNWNEQFSTVEGLAQLRFVNLKTGWSVGTNGTIIHTIDGGRHWKRQISGTAEGLLGLAVLSEETVWACGAKGQLLFTVDAGLNWKFKPVHTDERLYDIVFANSKNGWAIGYGSVYSTVDAGATWENKTIDRIHLSSVTFADSNLGFITAGPSLLRTSDGGKSFQEIFFPHQGNLSSVSLVTSKRNYLVALRETNGSVVHIAGHEKIRSESTLFVSKDGGVNWTQIKQISSANDQCATVTDMQFFDELNGWLVGKCGLVLSTSDGGLSWHKVMLSPLR